MRNEDVFGVPPARKALTLAWVNRCTIDVQVDGRPACAGQRLPSIRKEPVMNHDLALTVVRLATRVFEALKALLELLQFWEKERDETCKRPRHLKE